MRRPHSAVALPSRTGGGRRRKAASGAAAGVWRSRKTSTHVPSALCSRSSQPSRRRATRLGLAGRWGLGRPQSWGAAPASADYCAAVITLRIPSPGGTPNATSGSPPPLCGRACGLTREVGWPSGSPRFAGRLRQGWAWAGATSPPWRPPPHYTRLRHVCSSEPACFPLCPQGNCPRCCPFGPALKRTLRVAACQID